MFSDDVVPEVAADVAALQLDSALEQDGEKGATAASPSHVLKVPSVSKEWNPSDPTFIAPPIQPRALAKLKSEIFEALKDPLPGIFVVPDEDDIRNVCIASRVVTLRCTP